MQRPKSLPLAAGAQMMLGGAVLLALSQATGELQAFPHISLRAALALLYLIVGGSLLGFTAYVWLLARMPATRVASHAYVNPLVAVALGYFVAGEALTLRMILASALVVASVFLILRTPAEMSRRECERAKARVVRLGRRETRGGSGRARAGVGTFQN
jgi:drug/metabolite transporter (DMT)-like permease